MSLWNYLACSIHSEFLQPCFLTEPNLTFIMAQEKHLPNDTTSLYVTEIKGDISNRIAVPNMEAGDSFPESMEQKKSEEGKTPQRWRRVPPMPAAYGGEGRLSEKKQLFKNVCFSQSFRKNPKHSH